MFLVLIVQYFVLFYNTLLSV